MRLTEIKSFVYESTKAFQRITLKHRTLEARANDCYKADGGLEFKSLVWYPDDEISVYVNTVRNHVIIIGSHVSASKYATLTVFDVTEYFDFLAPTSKRSGETDRYHGGYTSETTHQAVVKKMLKLYRSWYKG